MGDIFLMSVAHCMHATGAKFLTDDEAVMVGEKNMRHSHATHDLYNAIANGDFPEWTWYIQVMPVDTDPASIGFDPLDDTKARLCSIDNRSHGVSLRPFLIFEAQTGCNPRDQSNFTCYAMQGLRLFCLSKQHVKEVAELCTVSLSQLWPEEEFPLIEFGRMVLDTNVKNYYAEVCMAPPQHLYKYAHNCRI